MFAPHPHTQTMMKFMMLLKDAASELKDLKEQSEEAAANGQLDGDDGDDEEFDMDGTGSPLPPPTSSLSTSFCSHRTAP